MAEKIFLTDYADRYGIGYNLLQIRSIRFFRVSPEEFNGHRIILTVNPVIGKNEEIGVICPHNETPEQKQFYEAVKKWSQNYANTNNFELVDGTVIGGLERGIQQAVRALTSEEIALSE